MNTGLQDAHNIAWKLAMVISGKADKSLLSTYQSGYELILFCPFNAFSFFFSLSLFKSLPHIFCPCHYFYLLFFLKLSFSLSLSLSFTLCMLSLSLSPFLSL